MKNNEILLELFDTNFCLSFSLNTKNIYIKLNAKEGTAGYSVYKHSSAFAELKSKKSSHPCYTENH